MFFTGNSDARMRAAGSLFVILALSGGVAFGQGDGPRPADAKSTTAVTEGTSTAAKAQLTRSQLRQAVKPLLERIAPQAAMVDVDQLGSTQKGCAPEKYVAAFGAPDREVSLNEGFAGLEKAYPGGKAFVYRDPGVVVAFNAKMRSERVLVASAMQGLPSEYTGSQTAAPAKQWQGQTKYGASLRFYSPSKLELPGLGEPQLREIEQNSQRAYSYLVLEVDNTKGKCSFEFARSMFTAISDSGEKTVSDWQTARIPWEMSKEVRAYFLGAQAPMGEKRTFVITFPKQMDPSQVARIEVALLYGNMVVCQ